MYICEHFTPEELLPKQFYEEFFPRYGKRLWQIFNPVGLKTIDQLRETYGKMLCNTWKWGGNLQFCGYRPPTCGVGSLLSQHRFANAFDLHPQEASVDAIREDILNGQWPTIKGLELGVSWLHIDFRNSNKLITFRRT